MKSKKDNFYVVWISIKTINKDGNSAKDIWWLWWRLFSENISDKIKNKISWDIYSVYFDYEWDFTAPYTCLIWYKVSSLSDIPEWLASVEVQSWDYQEFPVKWDLLWWAVADWWWKIWETSLDRTYKTDFELYPESIFSNWWDEMSIFIWTN